MELELYSELRHEFSIDREIAIENVKSKAHISPLENRFFSS